MSERSPELLSPLVVSSEGAKVEVDSSRLEALNSYLGGAKALDDRDPKGNTPATLHISKSELIRTNPTDASGFDVLGGSTFELTDSTLAYRARVAISGEEAANISLVRSVIRPVSKDDAKNRVVGAALIVNDGVRLSLDGSAIVSSGKRPPVLARVPDPRRQFAHRRHVGVHAQGPRASDSRSAEGERALLVDVDDPRAA